MENKRTPSDILQSTKQSRLNYFFERLDDQFSLFKDVSINNILFKMPLKNQITNKRYYQFRVKLPIRYENSSKYRIRVNNIIYDLYKADYNYYFVDVIDSKLVTKKMVVDFSTTIQHSLIFYLFYSILSEVTSKGTSIELHDHVFRDLTDGFNTPGGDMIITFTTFSVKNKIRSDKHLYISIFN